MSSPGRLLRVTLATVQSLTGRLAYRLGWRSCARRRFEQVLLLCGADFTAYVHLGRIAFDGGDYASWRREFEHARRTDPIRFAQLRHANELIEPRLAGTPFDSVSELDGYRATDTRATWRALHPFGVDARGRQIDGDDHDLRDFDGASDLPLAPGFDPIRTDDRRSPGEPGGFDRDPADDARTERRADDEQLQRLPDAAFTGDDFASAAERRRFQLRRPIDRRDIARCDLNELARRLTS